jgi:acid stress-induced BolA-like protein IbaG/YrbA
MTMTAEQIAALITERMPGADPVRVEGDDGVHFSALVVSPAFEGMRAVQRHQRVYAALQGLIGGAIHALALDTLTPAEWATRGPLH